MPSEESSPPFVIFLLKMYRDIGSNCCSMFPVAVLQGRGRKNILYSGSFCTQRWHAWGIRLSVANALLKISPQGCNLKAQFRDMMHNQMIGSVLCLSPSLSLSLFLNPSLCLSIQVSLLFSPLFSLTMFLSPSLNPSLRRSVPRPLSLPSLLPLSLINTYCPLAWQCDSDLCLFFAVTTNAFVNTRIQIRATCVPR